MSESAGVDGEIEIVEVKPADGVKRCLIGLPDVGLVGLITVNHLIQSLNVEEVGYVESRLFPPVMVVHKGEPKSPVRLYAKDDLAIITSEIPVSTKVLSFLADTVLDWTMAKKVELLISLSGISVPNRLEIENPEVYGVPSTKTAGRVLKDADIQLLEEGFMVGPHAAILKGAIKRNLDSVILLAQSHYQYPDPGAALSVVNSLNRLLGLRVEVDKLQEQAEEIRLKMREVMQRTYDSMQKMQKTQEQELPPMYV